MGRVISGKSALVLILPGGTEVVLVPVVFPPVFLCMFKLAEVGRSNIRTDMIVADCVKKKPENHTQTQRFLSSYV